MAGNLPRLGRIYPQAKSWIFSIGGFVISGEVDWSHVDESRNIVLGNNFAAPFDSQALTFDGQRAEFGIGNGVLNLYLPFEITNLGQMKNPIQALMELKRHEGNNNS